MFLRKHYLVFPGKEILNANMKTVTLNLPTNTSGIVMVAVTAAYAFLFYYNSSTTGSVSVNMIAPSGATVTTGTNQVSFSCASRVGTIHVLLLRGDTFPTVTSNQ